ncbi:hypothetical protein Pmar_PMAR027435 [Perkinsus marinus ATCC 50983]|uniref:Uncharacterized protein n=1 Tax=Perkinsus marinus (strain ATCC 50983 / TXsc) TaxID=423536 RepID=C5KLS9_PERM5|nr:hypothetical protein Pmar_PMAR027435 [Perkinsus marinus ATCC 50983]EER14573.1 hypothetical protein Pmar_PMAR027435 [Perkinsus marinus ATCC 50983]|eukprot:XP_002782778.1 hypothetical protein Pmar_PMAR027435 [Perkinsus marinus ATCC 50983]
MGGSLEKLGWSVDFDVFIDQQGRDCLIVADTQNERLILWRGDDPIGHDLTGPMQTAPCAVTVDDRRRFDADGRPRAYFGMYGNMSVWQITLDTVEPSVEVVTNVFPLDIAIDKRNGRLFVADAVSDSVVEIQRLEE